MYLYLFHTTWNITSNRESLDSPIKRWTILCFLVFPFLFSFVAVVCKTVSKVSDSLNTVDYDRRKIKALRIALCPVSSSCIHHSPLTKWTICSFWIETAEWRRSLPWNQKKNLNVFFYNFPYLCFCLSVLFWTLCCSLCSLNAQWSSAQVGRAVSF